MQCLLLVLLSLDVTATVLLPQKECSSINNKDCIWEFMSTFKLWTKCPTLVRIRSAVISCSHAGTNCLDTSFHVFVPTSIWNVEMIACTGPAGTASCGSKVMKKTHELLLNRSLVWSLVWLLEFWMILNQQQELIESFPAHSVCIDEVGVVQPRHVVAGSAKAFIVWRWCRCVWWSWSFLIAVVLVPVQQWLPPFEEDDFGCTRLWAWWWYSCW